VLVAWVLRQTGSTAALDLGGGLAGEGGLVPSLAAVGAFQPGGALLLAFAGSVPHAAPVYLVAGPAALMVPFKGGVLVPRPDLVQLLVSGAEGGLTLPATLPVSLPPWAVYYLQCWQPDPAGPAGFSASNAVLLLVGPN
jgi:hypothetical protein